MLKLPLEPCVCGAPEHRLIRDVIGNMVTTHTISVRCLDCGHELRERRGADVAWNVLALLNRLKRDGAKRGLDAARRALEESEAA